MEVNKTHPLIITAAASVVLTCGIAIASMTGLLPSSKADDNAPPPEIETLTQDKPEEKSVKELPPLATPTPHNAGRKTSTTHVSKAAPEPEQVAAACRNCGRVVDIRAIKIQGESSGLGAVAGGVAGALLGKQFGNGNGQKALTVAGAVGGAVLGNKVEKDQRSQTVYDVVVRFEDGSTNKYRENQTHWQVGDPVRVENGRLTADRNM